MNGECENVYTIRGDEADVSFPWQDYNGKRQIKFGANLGKYPTVWSHGGYVSKITFQFVALFSFMGAAMFELTVWP